MNIFLLVIFFALVLLFLPFKIDIILNAKLKQNKVEFEPIPNLESYVKIKAMAFLPIFKKDVFGETKKPKKDKANRKPKKLLASAVYNSIKFDRFILSFGINTFNPILNSYINAGLNTAICMYVNKESKKFNFNKMYYQIYLADTPCVLSANTCIYFFPFKFLFKYIEMSVKNIKSFSNKLNKRYSQNV